MKRSLLFSAFVLSLALVAPDAAFGQSRSSLSLRAPRNQNAARARQSMRSYGLESLVPASPIARSTYASFAPVSAPTYIGNFGDGIKVDVAGKQPAYTAKKSQTEIDDIRNGDRKSSGISPASLVSVSKDPVSWVEMKIDGVWTKVALYEVTIDPSKDRVNSISLEEAGDANDIQATSLQDFLDKLRERAKNGKIKELNFYGHGGGGNANLGSNSLDSTTLKSVPADIQDCFAPGATIKFYNCCVGKDEKFLNAVATTFLGKSGGTVYAYTSYVGYGEYPGGWNFFDPEKGGHWVKSMIASGGTPTIEHIY